MKPSNIPFYKIDNTKWVSPGLQTLRTIIGRENERKEKNEEDLTQNYLYFRSTIVFASSKRTTLRWILSVFESEHWIFNRFCLRLFPQCQ